MKVLMHSTRAEAENTLAVLHQVVQAYWTVNGFTILTGNDDFHLISRVDGTDKSEAAHTISWAEIEENEQGFYFQSPTHDFPDWRDYLPDGFTAPVDTELPESSSESLT